MIYVFQCHSPKSSHPLPLPQSPKDCSIQLCLFCCLKKLAAVQLLSCVQLFGTPWTEARQASLSFTVSWSLLKLMSIKLVMPLNHLILCHPLLLMPSIFPSIRVFSNESALCIRWLKDWSFSFHISASNEYSGRISFRMDWFDLPPVQETLKSLLNLSVFSFYWHWLWCSLYRLWDFLS